VVSQGRAQLQGSMQMSNRDFINQKHNRVLQKDDRMDPVQESRLVHLVTDLELITEVLEIRATPEIQAGIEFPKSTIGRRAQSGRTMVVPVSLIDSMADQKKGTLPKTESKTAPHQNSNRLLQSQEQCRDNSRRTSNKHMDSKVNLLSPTSPRSRLTRRI